MRSRKACTDLPDSAQIVCVVGNLPRLTIFGSRSRAHSAVESQMSSLSESLNSRTFGQRIAQRRLIFYWQDEKFDDCLLRTLGPETNEIKGLNS